MLTVKTTQLFFFTKQNERLPKIDHQYLKIALYLTRDQGAADETNQKHFSIELKIFKKQNVLFNVNKIDLFN